MAEIKYSLIFRTPVSIFSGLAIAGLVDRMVMRNNEGLPYLPGSSVKGRWRFFAERLLRSDGLPEGLRIHGTKEPLCKEAASACTLCKLFGNSAIPGMIQVGQAELDDSQKPLFLALLDRNRNPVVYPDTEIRPGIAISRTRRTTLEDHLFFDEAVPSSVTFSGKVRVNDAVVAIEKQLLSAAGRLVDRIGGRKAIGRGALENGIQIREEA
jgi:CRISPR-associated protein Csx10